MDRDRHPGHRIRTDTILLTAGLLLLVYLLGNVLLLIFAAVLLAVGLDGLGRVVSDWTRLPRGWAVTGVCLGITAFILGALGLSAVSLFRQMRQVGDKVGDLAQRLHRWVDDLGAMEVVENIDAESAGLAGSMGDLAGTVMTWGMGAVGAVSSLSLIIILTLFLVANPGLYRRGAVILVPPARRPVVQETLSAIALALRWWFLGQVVAMVMLGVTVGLGLFLLGIELWLALAVLTALLAVVPFIGPLIATVPIVAVGFAEGAVTGAIVLGGYIVIQTIEGEILTPLIQQRAVNLAPALLIAVQVVLTLIFGVAGLILAAPLTIVAMVAVQKLWVEHTLGEPPS
ncbi:MAG: AI-2E family transporter [Pseudotabrizicola sp.]|uniref:AI-2E family transporter n=1 Tax=Pseudotabrizicola sp. TaxID=2939647 RepID=UPI002724C37D|nr:AI-2E family transporter [Pseudotabrizicola sp.]MDO9637978.1 AI-2E family transporter [Pseudotabrizicola sp.]